MFVGWVVHVHIIIFPLRLLIGTPPPFLAIVSNILPRFIDVPRFKVVKFLNTTFIGVPFFSVSVGLGPV